MGKRKDTLRTACSSKCSCEGKQWARMSTALGCRVKNNSLEHRWNLEGLRTHDIPIYILPIFGIVSRASYIIYRVQRKLKMWRLLFKKQEIKSFSYISWYLWHIMVFFVCYLVSHVLGHARTCWVSLDSPGAGSWPARACAQPAVGGWRWQQWHWETEDPLWQVGWWWDDTPSPSTCSIVLSNFNYTPQIQR